MSSDDNNQEILTNYFKTEPKEFKINLESDEYPFILKNIKKPPETIYAIGNIDLLNKPSVAIVGTRKPSKNGRLAAKQISKIHGKNGLSIVSGLAKGIDSIAMKAALNVNAPVIAVLPSSLDNIVPKQNQALAEEILQKNGLLISEYPEGTTVQKYHYINRNRIISGISILTIVVETTVKGGTMYTVQFAKEQKKPLLVVDLPNEGNQVLKNKLSPILRMI
ncbi:DNA-processing protein DprA [Methanobacterium sp. MZD130B]|uniref:DNA-processing protein DprA n=1 Tax=Methanobacterium sp. MZD130B TaxID=3394378 RepID=UPI0039FD820D